MGCPSLFRVSTTRGRRPGPTGAAGPGGDWSGRVITYLRRSCGGLGPLRSGKSGRAATHIGMGGCPLSLVALSVVTARTCRYSRALDSESAGWRPNLVRSGAASLGECRAGSFSLGSGVLQPWPGPMAAAGRATTGQWTPSRRAGTRTWPIGGRQVWVCVELGQLCLAMACMTLGLTRRLVGRLWRS